MVRPCIARLSRWSFSRTGSATRSFLPANAGKSGSDQEDAQISEELRHGINFEGMAKAHNRTVGSIIARLVRLGKNLRRTARRKVLVKGLP